MSEDNDRIIGIELDEGSIVRWNAEIAAERDRAIDDLLRENRFRLRDEFCGPYRLMLSLRGGTLVAEVQGQGPADRLELFWPMRPLRKIIKDYFLICESYFGAIKGATANRIETIDMARRGLHDEGAELLGSIIRAHVDVDSATARRLFTLVCVLHLRA